ncbi:FAD-binding protein [Nostocaceae cyanobacterium CENA357]|uniref:UDP-N-acetylenolpyruvoylglucosamine reductase n=1 Tax=Atlanticothrix silvestris CENA357 TaxID=1725252 RepID=A0A8J7HF40_9CYAN|nr:FAD-binding protein [Atlanticothrix silvestris]MBH8551088.1 FAD-binding protein [Atlanticothrix silvestris CENA357]
MSNSLVSTSNSPKVYSLTSNKFSHFRTLHNFKQVAEINNVDDLQYYCSWAKENKSSIYILGNGSNTLFVRKNIKSLILKNKLPKYINPLSTTRLEVSSSVLIVEVLKYCYQNSLNSFYYLASVPATIGGALAMNAGRGKQYECTIYDFIEKITYFEDGYIKTLQNNQILRSYRQTIFTGKHSKLILSAVFKFEKINFDENPLTTRQTWAKEHQDNTAPNCGTVFKFANSKILESLKGVSIGKAMFSTKTSNWILNKSQSPYFIIFLINLAKILHLISFQKIAVELITID